MTVDCIAKDAAELCMDGRKHHFLEIYKLCRNDPQLLSRGIKLAQKEYLSHHNPTHVFKSLVYFNQAERDHTPIMSLDATWEEVKKYFHAEVPRIAKKILHLK